MPAFGYGFMPWWPRVYMALMVLLTPAQWVAAQGPVEFKRSVRPILERFCYDCHADGADKGGVSFDEFASDQELLKARDLWWKALKNVRAGIMPPARKEQPGRDDKSALEKWIKEAVFKVDPKNPDPGRITLRRLNRVEYHNTIRDLTGVEFDTQAAFPPDDAGHGFDNIGDVLALPPMLLEKYVTAANQIVSKALVTANQARFFPREIPASRSERMEYARELLGSFARKAFRRPADKATVDRLVRLAADVYERPGLTFEQGVGQGMVAVLCSPRFLFREEAPEATPGGSLHPFVDEHSLASRLSYFLWSSMPDEELFRLAAAGQLRARLSEQVERMLEHKRSEALVRNFVGQWLRARDIEDVNIEALVVLAREDNFDPEAANHRKRFRELNQKPDDKLTVEEREELKELRAGFRRAGSAPARAELDGALRLAMRFETERVFDHVLRNDRSLLELIDANYTFLNERLAKHYGIPDIAGKDMRLVKLPPGSPRGGILTQGTVLGVTSNPTRTSPVKRGLFVLDSILGTPPPPPPPDIPPLEDAAKGVTNRALSLRETLAVHRENALCASCHNRMDPLGLALENFNAMGMWRDMELGEPIDAAGQLATGEEFSGPRELKQLIARKYAKDFYRTVAEKLLIYALGRGLEYYDVETVDQIVERIETANGRPSALIAGVVESAPFQKTRRSPSLKPTNSRRPEGQRADAARKP